MINFTHSFPFSYSLLLSTVPSVYLFLAAERTAEIGVSVGFGFTDWRLGKAANETSKGLGERKAEQRKIYRTWTFYPHRLTSRSNFRNSNCAGTQIG